MWLQHHDMETPETPATWTSIAGNLVQLGLNAWLAYSKRQDCEQWAREKAELEGQIKLLQSKLTDKEAFVVSAKAEQDREFARRDEISARLSMEIEDVKKTLGEDMVKIVDLEVRNEFLRKDVLRLKAELRGRKESDDE
jgi:hypothetical protein